MFKFNFDLDDEDLDKEGQGSSVPGPSDTSVEPSPRPEIQLIKKPHAETSLSQFATRKVQLDALPSFISYSPLIISLSSLERTGSVTLARRDLFDARFQLISEDVGEDPGSRDDMRDRTRSLDLLDAPSDLVPGVYEGGLKTWECSLDLVDYLHGVGIGHVRGRRVLEIGCGTAAPTLYLLQQIFSAPPPDLNERRETHIHVQDYNESVLELVTLPNIILAWYMSPASVSYRSSLLIHHSPDEEHPSADPSIPSNLPLPPSLKLAFEASLTEYRIHLRFFSGSWEGFDPRLTGGPYDLILTSETIYRSDGLGPLVKLLKAACGCHTQSERDLDALAQQKLTLHSDAQFFFEQQPPAYLCLVAAKLFYFGVGSGVSEFVRAVEGSSGLGEGKVETVWENRTGVGRRIMRVRWQT